MGAIIEKLTGVFAHTYIEENIFKPLKMVDSSFDVTQNNAARIIRRNEHQEQRFNAIQNGQEPKYNHSPLWVKIPNTGGVYSTPYDLIRFGNMLLNMGSYDGVRILGRKTVEKMTTHTLFNIPDRCWGAKVDNRQYGLGVDMRNGPIWLYSENTYLHEGAGACALIMDPIEKLCAAWFVPFAKEGWFGESLYNVTNIIWSGLI